MFSTSAFATPANRFLPSRRANKRGNVPRRMSYDDAIEFLRSLQLFGAKPGLERALRLAERAGHPHQRVRFIHVAGTNGKGSTCAMLEAIYRGAGLRVGLYTSPHLVSFRERIQINREFISEQDVVRLTAMLQEWTREFPEENHPTFFEVVTIMALCYFAEQKCDLVILETGLGGRLDATNIVTPLASVITNVQFDHEKWLGSTIEEIAREKAGIIKPRVPVITAADEPSARKIIAETAAVKESPLLTVHARDAEALRGKVNLRGAHQLINAALAVKTVELLSNQIPAGAEAIRTGLNTVQWPARLQMVSRAGQTIVLDGAHNPAGAEALAAELRSEFGERPLSLIIGVLQDKNWESVCGTLALRATKIVTTPVSSHRTASAEKLAAVCAATNPSATVIVTDRPATALASVEGDPLLVITGSFYLVGEAMELLGLGAASGERALNEWSDASSTL
jgi:dihydrofolate synthase / folylpolyglutamate synthase